MGRLQKLSDGQAGNQWASADKALGRFLYSTYTEKDYDVIWDNYMYISQDNWWVEYDFGKKNCSEAGPRRADVPGRLEDVWVERVGNLNLPLYTGLPKITTESCTIHGCSEVFRPHTHSGGQTCLHRVQGHAGVAFTLLKCILPVPVKDMVVVP